MEVTNKESLVSEQYKDSKNLDVRTYLHSKFSSNKYGWLNWVFDQFYFNDLDGDRKILELGCGNGGLWAGNLHRVGSNWDVTLSDISPGMLEEAKSRIQNDKFQFMQVDAEDIPFKNRTFDVVIANHMLYHLPNRDKALSEIRRVLKDGGCFYASTLGIQNMIELERMVNGFQPNFQYPVTADVIKFNLDKGKEELQKYFPNVEGRYYEDSLIVTETKPLVDYILTVSAKVDDSMIQGITQYLDGIINRRGSIVITKEAGVFIAS